MQNANPAWHGTSGLHFEFCILHCHGAVMRRILMFSSTLMSSSTLSSPNTRGIVILYFAKLNRVVAFALTASPANWWV